MILIERRRYSYLLELSLISRTPLLLVGSTGTGKTLCIAEKMKTFNEEEFTVLSVALTAQTSSAQIQVCQALDYYLLFQK